MIESIGLIGIILPPLGVIAVAVLCKAAYKLGQIETAKNAYTLGLCDAKMIAWAVDEDRAAQCIQTKAETVCEISAEEFFNQNKEYL